MNKLPLRTALIWSAASGCIALAWEILWSRLYNYVSGSRAPVFGYMLGSYLVGIALGALWSRSWQRDESTMSWRKLAALTLLANLAAFSVGPVTSGVAIWRNWMLSYILVAVCGLLLGVLFPLLCQASVAADQRAGARLSYIYLANIIGSGFGSLFTGFGLMEWLGYQGISTLLVLVSWAWSEWMAGGRLSWGARGLAIVALVTTSFVFDGFYERLLFKFNYVSTERFIETHESRHGVINIDHDGKVYGNGAFDGVLELGLDAKEYPKDWNVRAYFASAVARKVDDVLLIGVASGGWSQIMASHPDVKSLTAIEISDSYLNLIRSQSAVSSLLTNPKVSIVIDDGRRWMKANPTRKFDMIVMNTIIHWREYASSLLSVEFLTLAKSHLKPGGVILLNATGSARAAKTAMEVFPHTIMVLNNVMCSDAPLVPDRERWRNVLRRYQINGAPLFDLTRQDEKSRLEAVLAFIDKPALPKHLDYWHWCDRATMESAWSQEKVITDDNLGHEFESR